jgi:hypothetical protein
MTSLTVKTFPLAPSRLIPDAYRRGSAVVVDLDLLPR